jgi:hypothetical protein
VSCFIINKTISLWDARRSWLSNCWFDSQWGHWDFFIDFNVLAALCLWNGDSFCDWNDYQEYLPHLRGEGGCAPDDYNTLGYLAQSDCLGTDRQGQGDTRLTLTPSVIPNSNYVITVSGWNCLEYFCVFLYCNDQVHRDFLITLYK